MDGGNAKLLLMWVLMMRTWTHNCRLMLAINSQQQDVFATFWQMVRKHMTPCILNVGTVTMVAVSLAIVTVIT